MPVRPQRPGMRTASIRRLLLSALGGLTALSGVAAAHGGGHPQPYPQWLALAVLVAGVIVVAGSIFLGRRDVPRSTALGGVFIGLVVAAAGAVGLVQLSPVETLRAAQMPIARAWYGPLTLAVGVGIALVSLVAGRLKYPDRPRFAMLGVLLGMWVAYPVLGSRTNPAGYLLVVALPLAVGYVLYRDAREPLARVLRDGAARRFGVGTGVLAGLFFMFSMGMITFVPEHGVNMPTHRFVTVAPVANPLVYWSAVEFYFPSVPTSGVVSLGMAIQVGVVAVLVGLNGAVVARQWLADASAGTTEATTGTAAVAAPNACCCCGPIVSELAVVAVGPSAAAPLYWLFVDLASPVGALFFVGSVALLAGNLAYFGIESA